MTRLLAIPILLFPIVLTMTQAEAGCTTTRLGNQTFTNCDNGLSASSQQLGNTQFNRFSDGTTCTTQNLGSTSFTNCNNGFSASSQKLGNTSYFSLSDGTTGFSQSLGNTNTQFNQLSDGTTCTSQTLGSTSILNCDGGPEDAEKRGAIIGVR